MIGEIELRKYRSIEKRLEVLEREKEHLQTRFENLSNNDIVRRLYWLYHHGDLQERYMEQFRAILGEPQYIGRLSETKLAR